MIRAHALALLLVAGCGAPPGGGAPQSAPDFHADVAPRLAAACSACHGNGAPLDLADPDTVRSRLADILLLAGAGLMPPAVTADGTCGSWRGARRLSRADLEVLGAWRDAGFPLGTAVTTPEDETLQDVRIAIPRGGPGEHRCHLVNGFTAAGLLRSLQVDGVAHHVMLFGVPAGDTTAAALDEADPAPGWACQGTPGIPGAALLALALPGAVTQRTPAGTGFALPERLVVQVHRDAWDAGEDLAVILGMSHAAATQLTLVPLALAGFTLAPGHQTVAGAATLGGARRVLGWIPHMHRRGRALVVREPAGTCELAVDGFTEHAQHTWWRETALELAAPRTWNLRCDYALEAGETVTFGEQAENEMCTAFAVVTLDGG